MEGGEIALHRQLFYPSSLRSHTRIFDEVLRSVQNTSFHRFLKSGELQRFRNAGQFKVLSREPARKKKKHMTADISELLLLDVSSSYALIKLACLPAHSKFFVMICSTVLLVVPCSIQQLLCGSHRAGCQAKVQSSPVQTSECQFCHDCLLVYPTSHPPAGQTKSREPQQ